MAEDSCSWFNETPVSDRTIDPDPSSERDHSGGTALRAAENDQSENTDGPATLFTAGSRLEEAALDQVDYSDVTIISNPKLTQEEKQFIVSTALATEGLREWSDSDWQVVGMDFVGVTEPEPKWEKAIVYLHLADRAGNPPVSCDQGWQAVIDVSMDAGQVVDAGLPTLESHECSSPIVLQEPLQHAGNGEPASNAFRPSFVIAETDDVVSNHIFGSAARLNTPSYNSTIFNSMDRYVAFLLNQKWATSPTQHMTQIGWLMSSVDGCTDCGTQHIPRDSATLAFSDSSVFGNLEAHRIPQFEWKENEELVAGTWCNEDNKYTIWAQYAGKVFNHNTAIPCENPDNDSKVSNSIFLENWNSAESSWSSHVGTVEAHSAVAFRVDGSEQDTKLYGWEYSTNEEQDCTGARQLTTAVKGDLASGKAAKWTDLANIPPGC